MKKNRKKPQLCKTIKADGSPCNALAGSSGFCSVHSGLVPRLERGTDLAGGAKEIRKFLSQIAMALKRGKMRAHDVNALVNVANCLLRCHEIIEIEVKVKNLTERMQQGTWTDEQNPDLACLEEYIDPEKNE